MFNLVLTLLTLLSPCGPMAPNRVTYSIEIQDAEIKGLQFGFALSVLETLHDPQGWSRSGIALCPVAEDPDVNIILALPDTVDKLCDPIHTVGEVSCAIHGNAVINYKRWMGATDAWEDLDDYRRYVINHEVGHVMGMIHRHKCTKDGSAPLMMQQSRNRIKCEPNSYPTSHEALSLRRVMAKK